MHLRIMHSALVTVWCVVSKMKIIRFHIFEEENQTIIVDSEWYVHVLQNFFILTFRELEKSLWREYLVSTKRGYDTDTTNIDTGIKRKVHRTPDFYERRYLVVVLNLTLWFFSVDLSKLWGLLTSSEEF